MALIVRFARVTRLCQKSVFTESTPAARAGDRAGFFVARPPAAAARGTRSGNAPACGDGDTNCRLQKRGGHCFAPVLYNENTYSDVWRRKRRGRSPDRAKRDPGISQAAMMSTS